MRPLSRGQSRIKGYARTSLEEAVNYITGFSPVPIPLNLIRFIWSEHKGRFPAFFVDWALEHGHEQYYQEFARAVRLPYRGDICVLPQILLLDNTQERVGISRISLCLNAQKPVFAIPDWLRCMTSEPYNKLRKKLQKRSKSNERKAGTPSYWDGKNLRLVDVVRDEGDAIRLVTQIVSYFDYTHSNLLLDAYLANGSTLRENMGEYTSAPDGALEPLHKSPLANNLGVNTLLFTADGVLVMQKRSRGVAFRCRELCPAASGTVDVADLDSVVFRGVEDIPGIHATDKDVRHVLAAISIEDLAEAMKEQDRSLLSAPAKLNHANFTRTTRELGEELSVLYSDLQEINFLGITRELVRGGEPELFFAAVSKLSKSEVEDHWHGATDKWEASGLELFDFRLDPRSNVLTLKARERLHYSIERFIRQYVDNWRPYAPGAGITLLANLALWVKWQCGDDWF